MKTNIMHLDFIDPAAVKAFTIATILWIFGDIWPSDVADTVKLLSGIVFIAYNAHRWHVFIQEQKKKKDQ